MNDEKPCGDSQITYLVVLDLDDKLDLSKTTRNEELVFGSGRSFAIYKFRGKCVFSTMSSSAQISSRFIPTINNQEEIFGTEKRSEFQQLR
jgi:hypothetical protein